MTAVTRASFHLYGALHLLHMNHFSYFFGVFTTFTKPILNGHPIKLKETITTDNRPQGFLSFLWQSTPPDKPNPTARQPWITFTDSVCTVQFFHRQNRCLRTTCVSGAKSLGWQFGDFISQQERITEEHFKTVDIGDSYGIRSCFITLLQFIKSLQPSEGSRTYMLINLQPQEHSTITHSRLACLP